ncbi:hypothetical protein [Nitrosomonas sp. Nm166]|uniref:hypothetical protein n=1 Tax=Nitrosomonas sp. Nm166 TaxID=1881054 RepID=UPI00210E96C1|nr:hypothetical protein [Nitrosomonas sp. Nm166]
MKGKTLSNTRLEIVYNKKMRMDTSKWILIFFMLWLPVQGVTAAVLSVCTVENMNYDLAMISGENHHHDNCHKQIDNKMADDQAMSPQPCGDTSCSANSNILMSDYFPPLLANIFSDIAVFNSGFISFIPAQPQRPPLTVSF